MGKISSYTANSAPTLSDYIIGDSASGPTTYRYTFSTAFSLLNKTRQAQMFLNADNTGGANLTQLEANDVSLTAATNYVRASCIVPNDYVAGTSASIILLGYAASSNNMTSNYYIGVHNIGQSFVSWNYANNVTGGAIGLTSASVVTSIPVATIPSTSLGAGYYVTMAWKLSSAPTGTVVITQALFSYTASD